MWAAVPDAGRRAGRREAQMVRRFDDVPRDAERVIFFPRAAGGAEQATGGRRPMLLALGATAIVIVALLWEVAAAAGRARRSSAAARRRRGRARRTTYDPGRERRAEQRARELLRSCVNDEEWAMYRDLGFIRVWGAHGAGGPAGRTRRPADGAPYAYLIYPHKPIVAYLPQTARAAERVLRRRSRTRRARTAARGCPTPTTCSPSGWR